MKDSYYLIGKNIESIIWYFSMVSLHYFWQRRAIFLVDLNIERIVIDFLGALPDHWWGNFLLDFFFDVFECKLLFRMLNNSKPTGRIYTITNFLAYGSIAL